MKLWVMTKDIPSIYDLCRRLREELQSRHNRSCLNHVQQSVFNLILHNARPTKRDIVSWEPEGRYCACSSKIFRWEPEGKCIAIHFIQRKRPSGSQRNIFELQLRPSTKLSQWRCYQSLCENHNSSILIKESDNGQRLCLSSFPRVVSIPTIKTRICKRLSRVIAFIIDLSVSRVRVERKALSLRSCIAQFDP